MAPIFPQIEVSGKFVHLYGKVFQGKYTNPAAGQQPFRGWHKSAIKRVEELTAQNREARASEDGAALEAAFLEKLRTDLGLTAATHEEEQRVKRRKTAPLEPDDKDDADEDDVMDNFDYTYA